MNNTELTFIDALMTGDTSGAIERSEKREQDIVVRKQRLPIKSNDFCVPGEAKHVGVNEDMEWEERFRIERENNEIWAKEQYEKMDIKIIDKYDDLFYNVVLPEGWEIKATEHSMWNEVIDEKGRKRIDFFYKGAFYDREAFSNFNKRFSYREVPFDNYKTDASYEDRKKGEWYGVVYDCGKEIYRTLGIANKDYCDSSLSEQCKRFLDENYPLWKDVNAYWSDEDV